MEDVAIGLSNSEESLPIPILYRVPHVFSDGEQLMGLYLVAASLVIFSLMRTFLGLGDVVLPGIYLALLYRLDQSIHQQRSESTTASLRRWGWAPESFYFSLCLSSYVLAVYTCLLFLVMFNTGQPALIYIGEIYLKLYFTRYLHLKFLPQSLSRPSRFSLFHGTWRNGIHYGTLIPGFWAILKRMKE
jgi:hypothetical protein